MVKMGHKVKLKIKRIRYKKPGGFSMELNIENMTSGDIVDFIKTLEGRVNYFSQLIEDAKRLNTDTHFTVYSNKNMYSLVLDKIKANFVLKSNHVIK